MMRSPLPRWPLALLAASLAWPATSIAQFREPPAPAAYALAGVTVVRADGTRNDSVTIVIRDGLIVAMGPAVQPPADAELLEGDTLYVYPGFVDAAGKADYELPEVEIDRAQIASWNPPRDAQSFMPHRRLVDHLTASGAGLAAQRKKGTVAAAVHPDGRLMPGRGALLVFRKDAGTAGQLVAQPLLGPVMSFRGAQGVYPSTLFAVIAFYRQRFLDARRHAARVQAFRQGRAGMAAPEWDPDLDVLLEVMGGGAPVFFAADLGRDIQRVLGLAAELGFRPVIVGGEEAWKVADELRAADVPVLVSLDFPEPERWEPDEEEEKPDAEEEPPEPGAGSDGMAGQESAPEELDAATRREKARIEDAYANAGRLEAAGVRFALTSGGGEADLLEGTRKAIEYGLSETAALRALTATPAQLLGIDHMAQVVANRPATFIVVDGPLFAEKTRILYAFVEGNLERGAKAGGGEAPTVDVTGEWNVSIDAGGQEIALKMTLSQEGPSVTGSMTSPFGAGTISDGSVSGNSLSLTVLVAGMDVTMSGTVEGDEISGSGDSPQGSFSWKATRSGGPGGGPEGRAER